MNCNLRYDEKKYGECGRAADGITASAKAQEGSKIDGWGSFKRALRLFITALALAALVFAELALYTWHN